MHPIPGKANTVFANIVSTPTLTSWSQAYNAGSLFAVFSLTSKEPSEHLHTFGKELINALEEEYFTLEEKTLESIKKAVHLTWEKFPKEITGSFTVGAIIGTVSYLFAAGGGSIVLKRGEKMGTLLTGNTHDETISSASGFLETGDVVVLQTQQFAQSISIQTLLSSVSTTTPSDIAERLFPKIQEQGDGAHAAIVLLYESETVPPLSISEEVSSVTQSPARITPVAFLLQAVQTRLPYRNFGLGRSKKIMLIIACVLFLILAGSVYLSTKRQYEAKLQTMYSEIAAVAEKKFEEGQTLMELNKNLAHDDFLQAQKILTEGKAKLPKDSSQARQIDTFLKKVDDALAASSTVNSVVAKEAGNNVSALLSYEAKNAAVDTSFVQDATTIYAVSKSGISSIDKTSQKSNQLVKNAGDWTSSTALGTYLGNFYVLDTQKSQILKFVAAESGYGKANYLASAESADFSNATSIAIDGSVWVLFADGRVQKFTRGKPDTFAVSGLDKPFGKAVKIATGVDINNLYVLDAGMGRIMVLSKNGVYQSQYQADILKKVTDIEVKEKEKKIYLLVNGKIWQIDIQ